MNNLLETSTGAQRPYGSSEPSPERFNKMSTLATRKTAVPPFETPFSSAVRPENGYTEQRFEHEGPGLLAGRGFWLGGLLSVLIWTLVVLACIRA